MRQNYFIFFIIIVLIFIFCFCISNVSALACINLNLAKTVYLPEETVQVELDADVMRDILSSDIFFYRGSTQLPINIFISKVTDTKYFLWFDLPNEPNDYLLRVRGTCKDGSLYVANTPLTIKKITTSRYENLRPRVENKWLTLDLEEHILSAGALSHILEEEALTTYKERDDSCINQECSMRLNALTLINFKDSLVRQEMQDILETSQDNNTGCWGSPCDTEATAYALFSLAMTGRLDKNDSVNAAGISWLKENAINIEEKAIIYYLTKDSEILNHILNSQTTSGWWPKNLTSYESDIKATSLATFILKSNNYSNSSYLDSIEKSESWLLEQGTLSLVDESFMLVFGFQNKNIEPLLAFWPGIIKTESLGTFDLILLNKGISDIVIETNMLNSSIITNLPVNGIKNLRFDIPQVTTVDGRTIFENLALDYRSKISQEHYDYSIPILIFTEKTGQEGINGSVGSSEEELNESEQQEIINETEQEWENKTTELNESLIQKRFYFIEKNITKTADVSEGPFTISIRLENKLDRDIIDISLTYSSALIGVVERIDPSFIEEIIRGEKETITISFSPVIARVYEGEIIAEAKYNSEKITTTLPMTINITSIGLEEKTCSELGGKICREEENEICEGNITAAKDTFVCCVPADACKKKATPGRTWGIIISAAIIIILIIIYILIRKKPRKEMGEFLKEASKQYEKKFQRPSSIRRR